LTIRLLPSTPGLASLLIFDASGRTVRRFASRRPLSGGDAVVWDGLDEAGRAVPSGVYLVRLDGIVGSATATVVYIR
jgi:hypothetical protein